MTTATPSTTRRRSRPLRSGVVSSAGGHKTITVVIDYTVKHPKYGKILKRRTKLRAHDPENTAKLGDIVEIMETRPISKTKNWRLVRVVRRAET